MINQAVTWIEFLMFVLQPQPTLVINLEEFQTFVKQKVAVLLNIPMGYVFKVQFIPTVPNSMITSILVKLIQIVRTILGLRLVLPPPLLPLVQTFQVMKQLVMIIQTVTTIF